MNININIKNIFRFLKKEDPNIIDSWDKMPVGFLKDIHRITSDENLSEDDKSLQAAAILARMPYDTLLNLPLDEAQELVARTAFLYEKPEKKKIRKTYTLNGRTYVPLMSMEDMTTAQFIDFNSLINDLDERLPEILSIFLVPKGHKYNDGYDKNTVVKDITERLMVTEALGMASFFINGYKKYVMRTLLYSEAASRSDDVESPEGTTTTGEGSDESAQTPKRGNTLFIWLSLIEAVEDITRFDYEKTLNMQAIEFFALATYAFYKVEKEKAEIEKFRQTKRY